MPFRELTMIDVKEILRRWSAGQSDRKIAQAAGVDRKTSARYTTIAKSLFDGGHELTDDQVHEVAQRVQASHRTHEWRAERDHAVPSAHRALALWRPRIAPSAPAQGPRVARSRSRPARQLPHALALRA